MWHYEIWIHSLLTSVSVVHSTWPSQAVWHMHALTFNKWQKTKKKKKVVTFHLLTHGAMQRGGLTSLVICMNDNICDIRERNMTIRSEIWTTNIRSLGFRNIREWVILWGLILWSLGCILELEPLHRPLTVKKVMSGEAPTAQPKKIPFGGRSCECLF